MQAKATMQWQPSLWTLPALQHRPRQTHGPIHQRMRKMAMAALRMTSKQRANM